MLLETLRSELDRSRKIDPARLLAGIREFGFTCTMCGWCCCPDPDHVIRIRDIQRPSNAISVFPGDIRHIMDATGYPWLDIVEPDIYSGIRGDQTWAIGWILKRDSGDNCTFFNASEKKCSIYGHRPLICKCYPVFLTGNGELEFNHCSRPDTGMGPGEAKTMGDDLLRFLNTKINNYIAICEGLGDILDLDVLCEIVPFPGLVLTVYDGETATVLRYSKDEGFQGLQ